MTFYALFPFFILKIKRRSVYLVLAFFVWTFNIFIFRDLASNFLINHYETSNATIINDFLSLNFINQAPIFLLGCYLYFTLNTQPKKIEGYIFVAWILLGAGLRFFYKIEGFGFLLAYITLGIFVYVCIKTNIRFKAIEKLKKNSYAIYLVHFFSITLPKNINALTDRSVSFISWHYINYLDKLFNSNNYF